VRGTHFGHERPKDLAPEPCFAALKAGPEACANAIRPFPSTRNRPQSGFNIFSMI